MEPYREIARFSQWWVWLPLGGILVFFVYAILSQVVLGRPVGNNPLSNWGLVLLTVVIFSLLFTLLRLQLVTVVDQQAVGVEFGIFGKHRFRWQEIRKAEVVNLGWVGYGYRFNRQHGQIFTLGGKKALRLTLKSGKKITIATRQPEELQGYLRQIGKGK
jgi:hypothetical protein